MEIHGFTNASNGGDGRKSSRQTKENPAKSSRKGAVKGKGGPKTPPARTKGIWQRVWGKWVAEIREPSRGSWLWLGSYNTAREAALAYDSAARKLYKSTVRLNFSPITPRRAPQTVVFVPLPILGFLPPVPVYTIAGATVTAVPIGLEVPAIPRKYNFTLKHLVDGLAEVDDSGMWGVEAAGTPFDATLMRNAPADHL